MSIEHLEDWLLEAIEFYRPREFFRQVPGDSEDLLERLLPHFEEQEEEQELTEDELLRPEMDLFFLSFDPLRTLYESMDFGAALGPGLEAYVHTLQALARISRGAFAPTRIRESWDSPQGPIRLDFEQAGKAHQFRVDLWDGMFDFRLLLQLNLLLWSTPYRYEMAPMDEILFVTVLTAQEKVELERHRGLSFMVLDLPRQLLPLAPLSPPLEPAMPSESPVFYVGTLNENLDRCVGRLRFIQTEGTEWEGFHRYDGETHQEELTLKGSLDPSSGRLQGQIQGQITVAGEPRPYEGEWSGQLAPGGRVATGVWKGWFLVDAALSASPTPDTKVYQGQWGVLEEESLRLGEPHLVRTRQWLEMVWASRSTEDYPWLLPV